MFVLCLLITCAIRASAHEKNGIRPVKDYVLGTELRSTPIERRIFNYQTNGMKIDVKVVQARESDKAKGDDYFPEFPAQDLGKCIIEFSLNCVKKRFVRFLETVSRLDEITLLGQDVKLVKNRRPRADSRAMRNDSYVSVQRSVDDLFDAFTLRITLPSWSSKRERNQIDVMLDETAMAEARGKKDKGGGGGKGKGDKCKMMMMGMLMMVKMKLMGLAAMKGMMMGGMSLMLSMMMLKFGKGGGGGGGGGGGPWQSGGGGGGGGGGQLKEIVLLTKSSGGGGGGGGCCGGGGGSAPSDSYGAPPASSYGAPSGGGGGYSGGGGGWGRSFQRRPMMLSHNAIIKAAPASSFNYTPVIGEVAANSDSIDYPDYQDYQPLPPLHHAYQELSPIVMPSSAISNWNATHYVALQQSGRSADSNAGTMRNDSKVVTLAAAKVRNFIPALSQPSNFIETVQKNVNSVTSTSQPDVVHNATNVIQPTYMDEWQATAEKISPAHVAPSESNAKADSRQVDSRPKEVPLSRGS